MDATTTKAPTHDKPLLKKLNTLLENMRMPRGPKEAFLRAGAVNALDVYMLAYTEQHGKLKLNATVRNAAKAALSLLGIKNFGPNLLDILKAVAEDERGYGYMAGMRDGRAQAEGELATFKAQNEEGLRTMRLATQQREGRFIEMITSATEETIAFDAPHATIDVARRWLVRNVAEGRSEQERFDLRCVVQQISRTGLSLRAEMLLRISRTNLAKAVSAYERRTSARIEVDAMFCLFNKADSTTMEPKTDPQSRVTIKFVGGDDLYPASLQGEMVILGMSDDEIRHELTRPRGL